MDLNQFKAKFIEEAGDLTNQLEEILLDNEDSLDNLENVHRIFRIMHTLKGVSSMYGFDHIGNLAHDLESIFDLIRDGKQEFTKPIFNITLETVDQFRKLLADEGLEDTTNQKVQERLLEGIKNILGKSNDSVDETPADPQEDQQPSKAKETFYIIFRPDESLLFRGINILRLFEELAELGEYKVVNHTFMEHTEEKQNLHAWGVYLVTDKGTPAIEDIFMFVLDNCQILKVSNNNLFNFDDFLANLDSIKETNEQEESIAIQENIKEAIEQINNQSEEKQEPSAETIETKENKTEEEPEVNPETNNPGNGIKAESYSSNITTRISVDASKLDRLMYLVSELVTTKSRLKLAVDNKNYSSLISISEKIDELSFGFRENALNIRLIPVAEMLMPFKRLIRDLSKDLGKEVKFITQGIDTELDKNVIDRLSEPVMHILRNCVDHGIETPGERLANNKSREGNIKFTAFYSGANVFIQIQDDGAGIDPEKIRAKAIEKGLIGSDEKLSENEIYNLLFEPGFSTAKNITDVSGRGVGMDVVRKKIEEVRGEVEINSEKGLGTFITIKLHQTLSIIDTLLLQAGNMHFLVPVSDIEYCDQAKHEDIYKTHNRQIELENEVVPYVSLRDIFGESGSYPAKEKLVIINRNDKRVAILADKIIGDHQAVLKPLGEVFRSQEFLSGASMLGDGSLALMLDTNKLTNASLVEKVVA